MRSAYDHYTQYGKLGVAGRCREAHAFAEAAQRLKAVTVEDKDTRRDAIEFNQRLWTVIQAEVCDTRNTLPDDVKAKLLSLSLFMDKSSAALHHKESPTILEAMIAINRALAASQFADEPDR